MNDTGTGRHGARHPQLCLRPGSRMFSLNNDGGNWVINVITPEQGGAADTTPQQARGHRNSVIRAGRSGSRTCTPSACIYREYTLFCLLPHSSWNRVPIVGAIP